MVKIGEGRRRNEIEGKGSVKKEKKGEGKRTKEIEGEGFIK